MSLALLQRSRREVEGALRRHLRCVDDCAALRRALASEHIRAATYSASAVTDAAEFQPLHTTRLMTILRRNLDGLWPAASPGNGHGQPGTPGEDSYRSVLNDLGAVGDVVDRGGGFWIAAPVRLVETSDREWLLVIGGAPTYVVEVMFAARVESAAAARFVRRAQINRPASESAQPLEAWLGHPEPLPDWTRRIIFAHVKRLSRAEQTSAEPFELYVPDIYRDRRRQGRWMPATEIRQPLNELRLCRPRASYARPYERPYYLGVFEYQQGMLTLRRTAQVGFDLTRRLRFGLDEQLNASRSVSLHVDGDICTLDLRYPLPEPESRVLALGWTEPHGKGERYRFHSAIVPALIDVFQGLSIKATISRGGP